MRTRTLLTQVLAVNTALVGCTAIVAAIIARGRLEDVFSLQRMLLLGLPLARAAPGTAVLATPLLPRRPPPPLAPLLQRRGGVDPAPPGRRAGAPAGAATE